MRRGGLLLWPAALGIVLAGCGGAATPPTTGPPPARTPSDRVIGQVVSNQDGTVVVIADDGSDARVGVSARTRVTRAMTAGPADLTPGTCVAAGGQQAPAGGLVAAWVLVEGAAGCARPGAAVAGRPPGMTLAVGRVENVVGRDVTVRGQQGTSGFTLTVATPVARVVDARLSDVVPGRCVVARGRRDPTGRLTARQVHIVPTPAGGCAAGGGGVAMLTAVEPRPGTGGAPGIEEEATTTTAGGGGAVGVSAGGGGGGGGGGQVTPFPIPREPEGSGLTSPSEPPRPVPSAPPEFVPPRAPAQEMPTEPGAPSPGPGRASEPQGPSPRAGGGRQPGPSGPSGSPPPR